MSGFRVGIHGVPLPNVSVVTPRDLERVCAAGAETLGIYMDEREWTEPGSWAPRLRELLGAAGLDCTCLGGPVLRLLLHDEARRHEEVERARPALEAVAALGAGALLVGPGGFSPAGPWWYHPRNFEPASRISVARSLRELGAHAEQLGVRVLVEGHQASVLESATVMREVLEEAGSPAVGANFDPVNYLTPPLVARFAAAVDEMAAALGPRLAAVHVKDAVVAPQLAVHIDEAAAGAGVLDLAAVVAAAARAEAPALVEHLDDADADGAMRHLAALGVDERRRAA